MLLVVPALEHLLEERELERQRWRSLPCCLDLDYFRERCCWGMTMTWGLEQQA